MKQWRVVFGMALLGLSACVPESAIKEETPEARAAALRAALEERIAQVENSKEQQDLIQLKSMDLTKRCQRCHGEDGFGVRPTVPNLGGQNPYYIVDQFQRFADGRRMDFLMKSLAEAMTDEYMITLAIHYSRMPRRSAGGGSEEQIEAGKAVFEARCVSCHGIDGRGAGVFPQLAGQQVEYVINTLNEFKNPEGRRPNTPMTDIAAALRDEELTAVAFYIANM